MIHGFLEGFADYDGGDIGIGQEIEGNGWGWMLQRGVHFHLKR